MAAPSLADYTYQYKDTGILLNGTASPIWDVEKIKGLVDFPGLTPYTSDYDGAHGGAIYVAYFDTRTIVIDGTMYASSPSGVDTANEAMKATLIPDGIDYPFYFKHPGITQRYVMATVLDYKADVDTGRRIGMMPYQIQLGCDDPLFYIDNSNQAMALNTNVTVSNTGNVESFPIITVTGIFTTLNVFGPNGNNMVFSVSTSAAGDVVTFDSGNRQLKKNGVDVTSTYSSGTWPSAPKGNSTWRVTVGTGTPTVSIASKNAFV